MKLANLEGKTLAERFRLESKLGAGGYGAVFDAVQLSVGRRCAVKVLFPHLCDNEATVQRFRTEARTTSRLTHPNSVVIYDFGRDEELGLLFLAMELLDGDDLRNVIRERGWMSVEETVHVVSQAAHSLQEAHNLGLVHRDIKPHNIMLLERGSDTAFVKVIDFGIAKVVRNSLMTMSNVTRTGTIIGTPKYMAPEQIRDTRIDGRTDMYGLAISAYQMLIGRTPFEEGTALEIAARQIAEKPEPLRTFRPDLAVSDAFEAVLLKALEKKAADRFDTVSAFAQALEQAANAPRPTSDACEDTPVEPMRFMASVEQVDESAPLAPEDLAPEEPTALLDAQRGKIEPPRSETSDSVELSGTAKKKKTLATMAIPNPARPEHGGGGTRDGTTAEVAAEQDDGDKGDAEVVEEGLSSRVLSRVPLLAPVPLVVSSVLAVLVGVGLWMVSAGVGEPSPRPEHVEIASSASTSAEESTLTSSVQAQPSEVVDQGLEPEVEPEAEAEPEPESESEPEAEPEAEPEPEPEPEPEREPEVAPRPRMGSLEVRVIPWGTLFVDGRKVGEGTRHKLRLTSGRHRLVLKQSGEVRARRSVDVTHRSSKIIELVAK